MGETTRTGDGPSPDRLRSARDELVSRLRAGPASPRLLALASELERIDEPSELEAVFAWLDRAPD